MFLTTNITFSYSEQFSIRAPSFSIKKGEAFFVMGENGAGKSTFLRLCAGLLSPDTGMFSWENKPIKETSSSNVSYLGGSFGFEDDSTVAQTVRLLGCLYERSLQEIKTIVKDFLLIESWHKKIGTLSYGQRLRLAIVRLHIEKKPCWILDEPLNGLDEEGRYIFITALNNHLRNKGIAFIATHESDMFLNLQDKGVGVKVYDLEPYKKKLGYALVLNYAQTKRNL